MLDGCGIETPLHPCPVQGRCVAIDARWLWNRDGKLDREVIEAFVVAIDARWLWIETSPS